MRPHTNEPQFSRVDPRFDFSAVLRVSFSNLNSNSLFTPSLVTRVSTCTFFTPLHLIIRSHKFDELNTILYILFIKEEINFKK
jgi:hypothetical protein